MIIYRVEHAVRGNGPFSCETNGKYRLLMVQNINHHLQWPGLWTAIGKEGVDTTQYYCGFTSITHAVEWFDLPGLLKALRDGGFKLFVYEVDNKDVRVCYSGKQVFFRRDNAKVVTRVNPLIIRRYTYNADFT